MLKTIFSFFALGLCYLAYAQVPEYKLHEMQLYRIVEFDKRGEPMEATCIEVEEFESNFREIFTDLTAYNRRHSVAFSDLYEANLRRFSEAGYLPEPEISKFLENGMQMGDVKICQRSRNKFSKHYYILYEFSAEVLSFPIKTEYYLSNFEAPTSVAEGKEEVEMCLIVRMISLGYSCNDRRFGMKR